jgi:diguanylate cyclase (GGDEF)-like protein
LAGEGNCRRLKRRLETSRSPVKHGRRFCRAGGDLTYRRPYAEIADEGRLSPVPIAAICQNRAPQLTAFFGIAAKVARGDVQVGLMLPNVDGPQALDRLLRFRADIDALYEAERGKARCAHLRQSILVGLIFYNLYNLTSIYLMPDILVMSVAARILLVTPMAILIFYFTPRVSGEYREIMAVSGSFGAFLMPILLFWLSEAPLSAYTFAEPPLVSIYANMLLILRFRYALAYTLAVAAIMVVVVLGKSDLSHELKFSLLIQGLTATVFALYANWNVERSRCRGFLLELAARTRAETAERVGQRFLDQSLTDPLTGLPNRRALEQRFETSFREDGAMALLMVDVDHFKPYNDMLGHQAGDACLRDIAQALGRVCREKGAYVGRFGGEEFTVVLDKADESAALDLADALIASVRARHLSHPSRPDSLTFVTVSVGVCVTSSARLSAKELMVSIADEALYAAKRAGRNTRRIRSFPV